MCLAITLPANTTLSREHASNGFSSNRQGAGFAYIEDNQIKIEKGFFNFDDFWNHFDKIQQNNKKAKLVHFRIATCGAVTKENCHPWQLNQKAALIHNGTFHGFKYHSERISDTGLFVEKVLLPIFEKYETPLPNVGLEWLLGKNISYNKVAILLVNESFPNGITRIFNIGEWKFENGIYYSNSSYKTYFIPVSDIYKSKYDRNNLYKPKYDRNNQKRKKHPKYRIVGESLPLSSGQISKLCHTKKKKIKQLVSEGLVEKVWEDELAAERRQFPFTSRRDESYKKWWQSGGHEHVSRNLLDFTFNKFKKAMNEI